MEKKKTHEEYLALAKVLGEHIGVHGSEDPLLMAFHFIQHPDCPLCLELACGSRSCPTN